MWGRDQTGCVHKWATCGRRSWPQIPEIHWAAVQEPHPSSEGNPALDAGPVLHSGPVRRCYCCCSERSRWASPQRDAVPCPLDSSYCRSSDRRCSRRRWGPPGSPSPDIAGRQRPGYAAWTETIPEWATRAGQTARLQSIGASGGPIGQRSSFQPNRTIRLAAYILRR